MSSQGIFRRLLVLCLLCVAVGVQGQVVQVTKIDADVSGYLEERPAYYRVTIDAGKGNKSEQRLQFRQKVSEPGVPSKAGHTFRGWYVGEEEYDFSRPVWRHFTIQAKWNVNSYQITFNSMGGSGVSFRTVYHNTSIGSLPTSSRSAYTFLGWSRSEQGSVLSSQVGVTRSMTLYARWERITTVRVRFSEVRVGDVQYMDISVGGSVSRHRPKPPRIYGDAFYFGGWYTDYTYRNPYYGEPIYEDITLYARWRRETISNTSDGRVSQGVHPK